MRDLIIRGFRDPLTILAYRNLHGAMFDEEGSGFMRMNLGCPRSVLEKALNQIKAAYDKIA